MKKCKYILLAGLILTSMMAMAQTMSDQQIMQAAIELQQKGYGETDIAKELVMRGASIDQLQRLSNQIKAAQSAASQNTATTTNSGRARQNNGEKVSYWENGTLEQTDNSKAIFGRDIFRKKDLNFEPQMNIATPQNYVLGPGDEVIIDIYGASQEQFTQTVSPEGFVTVTGYGPIKVGGMTVTQATQQMRRTLGSRYRDSQMRLSVGQTRTIQVNVMGEVQVPGSYQLSAFASVFHALYMAGGVSEVGTLRNIKVFRDNALISEVDIYDYLMSGQMTGNVMLQDGDIIIVGTYDALVKIDGRVKRPMFYEVKKEETMEQLLVYSGGFAGDAYTDGIRVNRTAGAKSVMTVRNEQFGNFTLMDGDEVLVDSILPRMKNTVEIQGAIFRPGFYGLSDQMKTVSQLVGMADGPTEDAFTTRAVLYRMKIDRTYQAVPLALADILSGAAEDIELQNEDQLFIPSQQEKLERQYVVIHGEVFEPDTFRYAENESVEDLILRAGGLTEKASTSKVDIARRVIDPKATDEQAIRTKTFTIELHDSLLVNEKGFLLEPFDEVYVRMSPAYGKQMNVIVKGEILFAGNYALKTQDDRLSDLVRAAGGVSSHAYVKGARLQRRMTEEERFRRDQLLRINQGASKDSVDMDKLDISTTYYVGIDLAKAIENPGGDEDIVMREGDVLIIPSINNTVKINGEVLYPNTVSYIKGKRARFYINQAGGFSNNARRYQAYIIYANGKVAPASRGKVAPGCEIVVPTRPERRNSNATQWVSIASASASMASVAATIVAVISTVKKSNDGNGGGSTPTTATE